MQIKQHIDFDIRSDMLSPFGPENLAAGVRVEQPGIVLHGPYMKLQPGRYSIVVAGQIDRPEGCFVDATVSVGRVILDSQMWVNGSNVLNFELRFPAEEFEVRVHAMAGTRVTVQSVSLNLEFDSKALKSFQEYHRMGLRLILDDSSFVDRTIIQTGGWDADNLAYLKQTAYQHFGVVRDLTFLDIGAYFGLYSMVMAYSNMFERIIAFEADALNFRQLTANLLVNDPTGFIETKGVALSNETGEAFFMPSSEHPSGNRGGVGIHTHGTVVKKDKVDNLIDLKAKKIIAKVDVEGHEMPVLQGMKSTLVNNKMLLQVEVLDDPARVDAYLTSCNYRRIHQIDHDYYYINFA